MLHLQMTFEAVLEKIESKGEPWKCPGRLIQRMTAYGYRLIKVDMSVYYWYRVDRLAVVVGGRLLSWLR